MPDMNDLPNAPETPDSPETREHITRLRDEVEALRRATHEEEARYWLSDEAMHDGRCGD